MAKNLSKVNSIKLRESHFSLGTENQSFFNEPLSQKRNMQTEKK